MLGGWLLLTFQTPIPAGKPLYAMRLLQNTFEGLRHLLFPRLCGGCGKALLPAEDPLCLVCGLEIPRTEAHHIEANETALRIAGRFPFEKASSWAYFTQEGLLQHLLHNIKYRQREDWAIALGKQLGRELKDAKWEVDTILPVPLHPKKQRQRGYNQSELLCDGIGEAMSIPVWPDALRRLRHTESQTAKNTSQRLLNVKDAFAVTPHFKEKLRGRHILLVDDVLTTGATLESCANALLQAVPNIQVSIATLAVVSS